MTETRRLRLHHCTRSSKPATPNGVRDRPQGGQTTAHVHTTDAPPFAPTRPTIRSPTPSRLPTPWTRGWTRMAHIRAAHTAAVTATDNEPTLCPGCCTPVPRPGGARTICMRVFRILQFHDIGDRRSRSLPTSRAAAPKGACRTEPRTRRPGTRQLPHMHAHPMPRRAHGIHGTVGEELCQGSQKAPRRPRAGARRQLLLIPRPNQAHPSEEHHLQRPRIELEAPLRPGCTACIPVQPGMRPDVRPEPRGCSSSEK
jgi:hypothetical protein